MTSSPFQIRDFWSVATPGTILCLLDGVYRGRANVIDPPSGLSGTSSNPITIRALNEGKVLIDGQFARYPVRLNSDNNWWILEGFNARNSSCDVVRIAGDSRNNVVRRVVGWDAPIGSRCAIFRAMSTDGPNLFEDVAGFGAASRIFGCNQKGGGMTVRRAWARFEGSLNADNPSGAINVQYTCHDVTWENVLATWDTISQPDSATAHSKGVPYPPAGTLTNGEIPVTGGIYFTNKNLDTSETCVNVEVHGSLAYVKPGAKIGDRNLRGGVNFTNMLNRIPRNNIPRCIKFHHLYSVMSPSHSDFGIFRPFGMGEGLGDSTTRLDHITSVGGLSPTFANWTVTNHAKGSTVSAVPSAWTNSLSSPGANLCHRYVNRIRTTTPLWPWPMNDRIKAATAMAGSYSGPCDTCVGGRGRRTETDVTADVDALLGPIPSDCQG